MAEQTANVVLTADVSQYNREIDSATSKTQKLIGAVNSFITVTDRIGKGVRKGLFAFAAADAALLTGLTLSAAKFDKQLSTMNATFTLQEKNSKAAQTSLAAYSKEILKLSSNVPAARGEVVALMSTMAKLGTSAEEASKAAKSVLSLSKITGESAVELSNSMVSLNTQMGTSTGTIAKFSDQLAVLSVKSASSASSIVSFASSLAPIARNAGILEKDLLAISAAFNKAGADGFAAGNAFNTMLTDITRMIQDGSPQLSKYANLIGVTVDQFKKMDATDRMVKIFQAINLAGPKAISILNQMGVDGIRAQKAIQAVASAGGLEAMLGASQNTAGAAEKGGNAASDNLFSQLEKSKNRFENFTTEIGQPLAAMATEVVKAFNGIAEALEPVVSGFTKFALVVGSIAAAVGGLVATLLSLVKILALPALLAFIGRSTIVQAARSGAGSAAAFSQTYNDRALLAERMRARGLSTGEINERFAARGYRPLGMMERGAYALGESYRTMAGPPAAPGTVGFAARNVSRLLGGGLQGWAAWNRGVANFYNDATTDGVNRGTPGGPNNMTTGQALSSSFKGLVDDFKNVRNGSLSLGDALAKSKAAALANTIASSNLTRGTVALIASFGELFGASVKLAMSLIGTAGKALASFSGQLLGMLKGPMGWMMIAMVAIQAFSEEATRKSKLNEDNVNRLKKYDDALGLSTRKLLSFSDAVDQATGRNAASAPTTVVAASSVTGNDTRKAYSQDYVNSDVKDLSKKDAVAYVRSMGATDPAEVQAIKLDLIKRFGASNAQQILDEAIGYTNTPRLTRASDIGSLLYRNMENYDTLLGGFSNIAAGGSWGGNVTSKNIGIWDQTKEFFGITEEAKYKNVEEAIGAARNMGAQYTATYGTKAGDQSRYVGFLEIMKGLDKYDTRQKADMLALIEQEYFGGESLGLNASDSPEEMLNKIGDKKLSERFIGVSDYGFNTAEKTLRGMMSVEGNPFLQRVSGSSSSGKLAVEQGYNLIGDQDVGGLFKAQMMLAESSYKLQGGFSGAYDDLQKMKVSIGNVDDKMYKLAKSAQDYLSYQEQRKAPFQSRQTNFENVQSRFTTAAAAFQANPNDQTVIDEYNASKLEYEKKQDEYQSFLQGLNQTYINYTKQMTRSTRDFNISMERNEREHQKSLKRMVEEGAKSLYDPYQRVQAQRVSSVEIMLNDLSKQNAAIARQSANLKALTKAGLNMDVIDFYGLADTQNAGQLQQILSQIESDPTKVNQLNQGVKSRLGLSGKFLKSDYNKSYRQSEADRKQQLQDTKDDRQKALADARTDLEDSLKQVTGTFDQMLDTALTSTNKILGTKGGAIKKELQAIKKDYAAAQKALSDTSATQIYETAGQIAVTAATSGQAMGLYYSGGMGVKTKDPTGINAVAHTLFVMDRIGNPNKKEALAYIAEAANQASPKVGHSIGHFKKDGKNFYAIYIDDNTVSFGGHSTKLVGGKLNGATQVGRWKEFAEGGIATRPMMGMVAEAGSPEAVIPLNSRGLGFLANYTGAVAREVAQLAYSSPVNRSNDYSQGGTSINRSTNFNGAVTVIANDPNEMARKLEQQRRFTALTGS